ncbi:MAG: hypothetical protein IJQ18_00850 [Paludibacteraceae bacterium]|nr:hypothetical protein [Paludibacteraceae bacterium]
MRRDVLTFLLFVVIATLVWYGHAMQSVRNTRVPVLIQYTGKPDAIGLKAPGLPDTVMIEVRDAGARLNTYHRDPLHLTIDLHSYIHGEKGRIYIPSDALRRSISDILQGTSRLIETQPEDITCDFFTEQEKSVLLVFRGDLKTANEYQIIGQPTLARKRMKIFGDEKTLSAIDTLYTEPQDLSEVSDTMRVRCAIEVPQGIRAEEDSVELCIIAERFTEKKFTIPVHIKGVPEGYHIRLFPKEVEVSVRVGMNHFSQVKANDIHATCAYSPERTDKLDVEISYTNPYITAAWAYPGVVEFILEQ